MIIGLKVFGLFVSGFAVLTATDGIQDGWHFLVVAAGVSIFIGILSTV